MTVKQQNDKSWWIISNKDKNLRFGNIGKGNWIYTFSKVGPSPSYEIIPNGTHRLLRIIFSAKSIKAV